MIEYEKKKSTVIYSLSLYLVFLTRANILRNKISSVKNIVKLACDLCVVIKYSHILLVVVFYACMNQTVAAVIKS